MSSTSIAPPPTHDHEHADRPAMDRPVSRVLVVVPLGVILGTFAVVVRQMATSIGNTDTYFHLRMGAEFLSSWTPWSPGTVSRFASADWVPSQWLGQVAYGAADRLFGLPGVAWLSGAIVLLFALVLYFVTRRAGSLVVSAFIVPVVVLACSPALSGRPQVLSYVFAALVTSAWLQSRSTGRVAWWIIPLTWVWAMVHGMWSVSILISVVAIVGIALDKDAKRPALRDMAAIPVLSVLVVALTPVGPGLFGAAARVGSINHYFAEWGPTRFTDPSPAVAALAMVLFLVVAMRSGPLRWSTLTLLLLAGAWLLYSGRTVPVGVAMLAPLLASELTRFVPDRARSPRETRVVLGGFVVALIALAVAVGHTSTKPLHDDNAAHESVAGLPEGTGLLNEWNEGGYDMWAHPHLDIVMHGYGDMFTDAEIKRNYELGDLDAGWDDVVRELGVRDALLYEESALAYALTEHLNWQVQAEDDGLVHLRAPADWAD